MVFVGFVALLVLSPPPACGQTAGAGSPPLEERPGVVIREIDDSATGDRWLLVRDMTNPAGPGRMVRIETGKVALAGGVEGEAEAGNLRIDFTPGWAQHPLLADAFADRLRPALSKLTKEVGGPVPVLFTAHSVPTRTVEAAAADADAGKRLWPGQGADPYAEEARHTAELVAARVPEIPRWWFAFQSQGASGGAWLGPSVEETLDRLAAEGVTALILQPIGFLCDHVEILFDVDILFREYAIKLSIRLERPESLNDSVTLAKAVADLAHGGLERLGKLQ